jgi:hypothetical protein
MFFEKNMMMLWFFHGSLTAPFAENGVTGLSCCKPDKVIQLRHNFKALGWQYRWDLYSACG